MKFLVDDVVVVATESSDVVASWIADVQHGATIGKTFRFSGQHFATRRFRWLSSKRKDS